MYCCQARRHHPFGAEWEDLCCVRLLGWEGWVELAWKHRPKFPHHDPVEVLGSSCPAARYGQCCPAVLGQFCPSGAGGTTPLCGVGQAPAVPRGGALLKTRSPDALVQEQKKVSSPPFPKEAGKGPGAPSQVPGPPTPTHDPVEKQMEVQGDKCWEQVPEDQRWRGWGLIARVLGGPEDIPLFPCSPVPNPSPPPRPAAAFAGAGPPRGSRRGRRKPGRGTGDGSRSVSAAQSRPLSGPPGPGGPLIVLEKSSLAGAAECARPRPLRAPAGR